MLVWFFILRFVGISWIIVLNIHSLSWNRQCYSTWWSLILNLSNIKFLFNLISLMYFVVVKFYSILLNSSWIHLIWLFEDQSIHNVFTPLSWFASRGWFIIRRNISDFRIFKCFVNFRIFKSLFYFFLESLELFFNFPIYISKSFIWIVII